MLTHFTRKTNRLLFKGLYQGGYWYFVTICTQNRECIFVEESSCFPSPEAKSEAGYPRFKLNQYGKIVEDKILNLANFYNLIIDEFVIMPNHIHLIIGDSDKSISKIISGLKSFAYKEIKSLYLNNIPNKYNEKHDGDHEVSSTVGILIQEYNSIWQKSFYDHVIRDENDLNIIREYIVNNPINWHLDSLNSINYKNAK